MGFNWLNEWANGFYEIIFSELSVSNIKFMEKPYHL